MKALVEASRSGGWTSGGRCCRRVELQSKESRRCSFDGISATEVDDPNIVATVPLDEEFQVNALGELGDDGVAVGALFYMHGGMVGKRVPKRDRLRAGWEYLLEDRLGYCWIGRSHISVEGRSEWVGGVDGVEQSLGSKIRGGWGT